MTGPDSGINQVFEELGGVDGMTRWAWSSPKNLHDFYVHIYPKLLGAQAVDAAERLAQRPVITRIESVIIDPKEDYRPRSLPRSALVAEGPLLVTPGNLGASDGGIHAVVHQGVEEGPHVASIRPLVCILHAVSLLVVIKFRPLVLGYIVRRLLRVDAVVLSD
jgi:hypothetical protein